MAELHVWGGAGEHGRSCYYLEVGRWHLLLDCGVKKQAADPYPLLDLQRVRGLDAVFLSHAHEDHSLALPLLVTAGYQGVIWTTRETVRQLPAYFRTWLGERTETVTTVEATSALGYGWEEVDRLPFRYVEDVAAPGQWGTIEPGLRLMWGPSGHLSGAVWLLLECDGRQIFYSGDYSDESLLLPANLPPDEVGSPDLAIIEAAYGALADTQAQSLSSLCAQVRRVLDRGGQTLLPVPLYGRGPELLAQLSQALPEATLLVDAALLDGAQAILSSGSDCRPDGMRLLAEALSSPRLVRSADLMRTVTALRGQAAILLAADAQLQAPAPQALAMRLAADARHAVLFTGHIYAGTPAAALWERRAGVHAQTDACDATDAERPTVACEVGRYLYKIHQGLPDVQRMLQALQPKRTLLVHAAWDKSVELARQLQHSGCMQELMVCRPGERLSFGE